MPEFQGIFPCKSEVRYFKLFKTPPGAGDPYSIVKALLELKPAQISKHPSCWKEQMFYSHSLSQQLIPEGLLSHSSFGSLTRGCLQVTTAGLHWTVMPARGGSCQTTP